MEKNRIQPIKSGTGMRISYARQDDVLEVPNLIEIQKDSYDWFLREGLAEVFEDISPIEDYSDQLSLEFVDYQLCKDDVKYSIEECKERDATYAAPLKVKVRLHNKETDEIKQHEIFMGDLPLMTATGTFIINGAERVIVSQLVRSPGIYYGIAHDKIGKELYSSTVIPNRGAWLEYETDSNDVFNVRVDRTRKVPITVLIRALGIGTNAEIKELFGEEPKILASIEKDPSDNYEDGLLELYKKIRPGEPLAVDSAESLITSMFFDPRRYDLAKVGRYKFNKKLNILDRLEGLTLAEPLIDGDNVLANAGDKLTSEVLEKLRPYFEKGLNVRELLINEELDDYKTAQVVKVVDPEDSKKTINIIGIDPSIDVRRLTIPDVYASLSYYIGLHENIGSDDEIDNLGNRRVRQVGELIQNQFRIGMARMERVIRERMTTQELDTVTPKTLINIRPVTAALKEFFGSSQLSKFMDQINPIAELTDKRRLSSLGPGGLSRERAGMDVRDVNASHYGRICPIESPEGQNIGLITSLAGYAKINDYGFIMTPYHKVVDGVVTNEVVYLTADEEKGHAISQAAVKLDDDNRIVDKEVVARYNGDTIYVKREKIDYVDVAPSQVVAITTSCIPFLEFDDAHRTLMGANMQRQAVPLLTCEAPIVGTGVECIAARDSGSTIVAKADGVVEYADGLKIIVKTAGGKDTYHLANYERSNASSCINHHPIVKAGDAICRGQVIADGPSTDMGELALGKNLTVAFMTFEGYNYEDAVILNERLVKDDVYTSLHISHYDIDCRDTKLGPEEITRDIPNVGEDARKNLDADGIVRIGTEVRDGDILVGKVTPKGMQELTSEEKLLHAIFGEKTREVRDTSLRVEHGAGGIVHDVKVYTKENSDELPAGVSKIIRVYIIQKRKIQVGDKMSGRHGNKGVISLVLPEEDMPYLPDGRPVDVMLNPLGVPSRMNIGQILELHLGMAGKKLGVHYATPVFDSATWEDISEEMKEAGMEPDGKVVLHDGRTGEPFDHRINVGVMYMVKLHHMVDDKLHARATGPYSLVTQQPLGGKAQFGGQRFGEMEVWALYAYGASHVLQEILTVKADDIVGRVKVYESLVKGKVIDQAGVPESFRVLVKEFQALGLDVQVIDNDDNVLEFKDIEEDEDDNDAFRIDEIDVTTKELNKDNVVNEELDSYDDYDEDLDDEEDSLDDLEFPGDIEEEKDILDEGEGEE